MPTRFETVEDARRFQHQSKGGAVSPEPCGVNTCAICYPPMFPYVTQVGCPQCATLRTELEAEAQKTQHMCAVVDELKERLRGEKEAHAHALRLARKLMAKAPSPGRDQENG